MGAATIIITLAQLAGQAYEAYQAGHADQGVVNAAVDGLRTGVNIFQGITAGTNSLEDLEAHLAAVRANIPSAVADWNAAMAGR